MLRITQNKWLILGICTLLTMQFVGCGEDTEDDIVVDGEAPALPPDESMAVDLSLFEDGSAAPALASSAARLNFLAAATRVVIVNSVVFTALTPPTTLFKAAKTTDPVMQDDGSYLWSFSKTILNTTFTADLMGTPGPTDIAWSMKVSSNNATRPVSGFEWYRGKTALNNTSGSWEFFDLSSPDTPTPTVTVDWSANLSDRTANLTFKNVVPGGEFAGDTLQYDALMDARSVSHTDVSDGITAEITWSTDTGAGSLTVPGYNGGEKACWGEDRQDILCN